MEFKPKLLPAVQELLRARRGTWSEVQKATGVPYRTIQNIAQGAVSGPSVDTVERLHHYLTQDAGETAA